MLVNHSLTLPELVNAINPDYTRLDQYVTNLPTSNTFEEVVPMLIQIKGLRLDGPQSVLDLLEELNATSSVRLRLPTERETLSFLATYAKTIDRISIHVIGYEHHRKHLYVYRPRRKKGFLQLLKRAPKIRLISYSWDSGECGYGEEEPCILVIVA